jgi:hypothetical protein
MRKISLVFIVLALLIGTVAYSGQSVNIVAKHDTFGITSIQACQQLNTLFKQGDKELAKELIIRLMLSGDMVSIGKGTVVKAVGVFNEHIGIGLIPGNQQRYFVLADDFVRGD